MTGLGLRPTKDLVETPNAVIKDGLPRGDAEAVAKTLTEAGATVQVK